jgi:cytochrome b
MNVLRSYSVWDVNVRAFHWINFVCVLGLGAVGVVILNDAALGVSNDGKILLKTVQYVLLAFALLHIVAVVVTELREGGSLLTAMVTGRKILSVPPADGDGAK